MQLAANWPDRTPECQVSSLIDLEPRAIGQQGGRADAHRERLSERTFQIGRINKRSDSPNPEQIVRAVVLWKKGYTYRLIADSISVPERTIRRYLRSLGLKRDYLFISKCLKGRKLSDDHKKNLSITRIIKGSAKGERNPNWKGGLSNRDVPIWNTTEYKIWRKAIFERDKYTCHGCGARGSYLEAHHILPRRDFPHLTFDITNGITLCKKCHDKTRRKEYLSISIWKQRVDI